MEWALRQHDSTFGLTILKKLWRTYNVEKFSNMRIYYKKTRIKAEKRDKYLIERNFISIRIVNRMFESFHVEYNGAYARGFTLFYIEIGIGQVYEPE